MQRISETLSRGLFLVLRIYFFLPFRVYKECIVVSLQRPSLVHLQGLITVSQ